MQLSAALFLLALSFSLLVVDHRFSYPGLAAFGGMLTTVVGIRITRTGLTQITNSGTKVAVDFGDVNVGFLIMLIGAIIVLQRLNKVRKEQLA